MANSLWAGAVATGLSTARPTTGDAPPGTFQFYYATDTGAMSIWTGTAWSVAFSQNQFAPTALTATATLTIAQQLGNLINVTSATAVTLTLPTGTLTDAGFQGGVAPVGASFEFTVINLGSAAGAVTMAGGVGNPYIGATGVPIGTSARFRVTKLATNSYQTQRLS